MYDEDPNLYRTQMISSQLDHMGQVLPMHRYHEVNDLLTKDIIHRPLTNNVVERGQKLCQNFAHATQSVKNYRAGSSVGISAPSDMNQDMLATTDSFQNAMMKTNKWGISSAYGGSHKTSSNISFSYNTTNIRQRNYLTRFRTEALKNLAA